MIEKKVIRNWANEKLDRVKAKIADMLGFSQTLYRDLIAEKTVLEDLLSLVDSLEEISPKFPMISPKDSLWKDAEGDDLPDIDREVIALSDPIGHGLYRVTFAHRVDPYRVIKVEGGREYYPMNYGKAGWNLPEVKWWLDLELPKTEEQ